MYASISLQTCSCGLRRFVQSQLRRFPGVTRTYAFLCSGSSTLRSLYWICSYCSIDFMRFVESEIRRPKCLSGTCVVLKESQDEQKTKPCFFSEHKRKHKSRQCMVVLQSVCLDAFRLLGQVKRTCCNCCRLYCLVCRSLQPIHVIATSLFCSAVL